MGNPEVIDKFVTLEAASKILCRALIHWKITYHCIKMIAGDSELILENPDNGDVMEVMFRDYQIWEIVVTGDEEIVRFSICEEKDKVREDEEDD